MVTSTGEYYKMKIQIFRGTDDVVYVDDVPYYREAADLTKAKKVLEKWEWSDVENRSKN